MICSIPERCGVGSRLLRRGSSADEELTPMVTPAATPAARRTNWRRDSWRWLLAVATELRRCIWRGGAVFIRLPWFMANAAQTWEYALTLPRSRYCHPQGH